MAVGKGERMSVKYAGALLVIAGCGGFGLSMAAAYRREEQLLRQLRDILQFMYCELQFHLTPLPELCRKAGANTKGGVGKVFLRLADRLEERSGDVSACMDSAAASPELTPRIRELLEKLGRTMGCFDMEGQLRGLEELRSLCIRELEELSTGREDRLRSYQTLALCAGAALVILFM